MSIHEAFVAVIIKLAEQRHQRAREATEAALYEFYIADVVDLNLLIRRMVKAEDPIEVLDTVHDGLRTLVVEELIAAGLVTDDGEN